MTHAAARSQRTKWWHLVAFVVLLPLLLAYSVIAILAFAVYSACLHATVWTWWFLR